MSERDASRRIRLVAVGAAVLAMVLAATAVIVVVTRDGEPAKPSAKAEEMSPPLREHEVLATDVVRLREIEMVVDDGTAKGLRVRDAALASALGLEADDVITSISGKSMTRERDAYHAISLLGAMGVTTLYVEIARRDKPMLLRWRVEGDLRKARYASTSGGTGGIGSLGGTGGLGSTYTPSLSSAADPLLDTIVKVGSSRLTVPRTTVEAMLGDLPKYTSGARIVPAVRNGQIHGLKLYAIRPSSVFRRLGFENGDTVHTVNGIAITTVDSPLEIYSKIRDADEVTFELTRRGHQVFLTVEITK